MGNQTSASANAPTSLTPPTIADLRKQYSEKLAKYNSVIESALATNDTSKIPEVRKLNTELNGILEQMLGDAEAGKSTIRTQREELVGTLNRIQRDYNGLKDSQDDLTLLRRIRQGETGASRKEFQFYLGLFFALCVGILAMVFFGGQIKLDTAMSPSTPASTAPLV